MNKLLLLLLLALAATLFWNCSDDSSTDPNSDTPNSPAMVLVNGGTFQMGAIGIAEPVHSVTLSSFYISKYEATQAEWLAIMGSNPSYHTGDSNWPVEAIVWYDILVYCNKRSFAEGLTPCYTINGSTNPADWGTVPTSTNSIWDAVTCNWSAKGYRIPTEAEWEFAARGGNGSKGYTYAGSNDLNTVGWYDGNFGNTAHPVGTKAPNELGIYDMSGSVWEWNWDGYGDFSTNGDYSASAQTNPHGAASGSIHVLRGGSNYSSDSKCHVAFRFKGYPCYDGGFGGVRLARSL